jgi:hypothetical protein
VLFYLANQTLSYFAQGAFDYQTWLEALVKWIVVSNIPFTEVEVPEFVELIQRTHAGAHPLKIPAASTIKQRAMKMSDEVINEIKDMFAVCLPSCTLDKTLTGGDRSTMRRCPSF